MPTLEAPAPNQTGRPALAEGGSLHCRMPGTGLALRESPAPAGADPASVPAEERRIGGVAYSGAAVAYWGETLVIDLDGVEVPADRRMQLQADHGYAWSEVHRANGHRLGVCDVARTERGLEIDGYLLSNDLATPVWSDLREGFPFELSVGLDIRKLVEYSAGETVTVNGEDHAGPVTVIAESRLREVSVVNHGADANTSTAALALAQLGLDPAALAALAGTGRATGGRTNTQELTVPETQPPAPAPAADTTATATDTTPETKLKSHAGAAALSRTIEGETEAEQVADALANHPEFAKALAEAYDAAEGDDDDDDSQAGDGVAASDDDDTKDDAAEMAAGTDDLKKLGFSIEQREALRDEGVSLAEARRLATLRSMEQDAALGAGYGGDAKLSARPGSSVRAHFNTDKAYEAALKRFGGDEAAMAAAYSMN
jgi:hypothetical protein